MRAGMICGTVLVALAVVYAGQPATESHEAIVKDMLATLGQAAKVLAGITDEGSANAARPDLKKIGQHLSELRKKADAVKPPTKKEKDRLETEYREKFEDVLKKLRTESFRVKGIPGGAEAVKEIAFEPAKKSAGKGKKGKK